MWVTAPDGAVRYGEFEPGANRSGWMVVARSVPLSARVLPRSPAGRRGPYLRLSVTGDVRRPAAEVMATAPNLADGPDYIAFRIPEGRGLLTVVAAVQPGAGATFPWAVWYSALAPTGEFKKAPLNYIHFGIGAPIAKTLIEVIKSRGSLPADMVEQLSIVKSVTGR